MSHLVIHVHKSRPLDKIPTYIGFCCREWVLTPYFRGRCGLCGTEPRYLRPDEESP